MSDYTPEVVQYSQGHRIGYDSHLQAKGISGHTMEG